MIETTTRGRTFSSLSISLRCSSLFWSSFSFISPQCLCGPFCLSDFVTCSMSLCIHNVRPNPWLVPILQRSPVLLHNHLSETCLGYLECLIVRFNRCAMMCSCVHDPLGQAEADNKWHAPIPLYCCSCSTPAYRRRGKERGGEREGERGREERARERRRGKERGRENRGAGARDESASEGREQLSRWR